MGAELGEPARGEEARVHEVLQILEGCALRALAVACMVIPRQADGAEQAGRQERCGAHKA